jgi:hypothetical protein
MKIIFLDFDGVLNNDPFLDDVLRKENANHCLDIAAHKQIIPEKVELVNEIIAKTNAKIVISSTWRQLHDIDFLRNLLKDMGLIGEIIGTTPIKRVDTNCFWPNSPFTSRGDEINEWMKGKKIDSYVILDDINEFFGDQEIRFVETDAMIGLTKNNVELAIDILNINIED